MHHVMILRNSAFTITGETQMRFSHHHRRCARTFAACGWALLALACGACATRSHRPAVAPQTRAPTTPTTPTELKHVVDPDLFLQHIDVLAHDSLTGRGIGTPGIEIAAGYIAGQFAAIGIEPAALDGSYFQSFEVAASREMTEDGEFLLAGVDTSPSRGLDYTPFSFSSDDAFEGDVVFVGYGLVSGENHHDDYADLDVNSKVVLMLRRQPENWTTGSLDMRLAGFRNKVYEARDRAAAAVLIVNRLGDDDDELAPFVGTEGDYGLPAFHVSRQLAQDMLTAGSAGSLEQLQAQADNGDHVSRPIQGIRLAGHAGVRSVMTEVRNVVGRIQGRGPRAHEYVVIGAHFDHLGNSVPARFFGGSPGDEPQIHNGADDNASGVAGVIEIGRAFMNQRPLNRSVLLVAFTAEETGLHGSRYFVDHPPVKLENIVAMLNLDMIGRLDPEKNTLQVFGTSAAVEFNDMIPRLVTAAGMKLRGDKSAIGPSDHTNFYKRKVPSVHVFTGLHQDYHRPGDDIEKINGPGGARVADFTLALADEILAAQQRPTYFEVKESAQLFGQAPRVVMGIMPGYADDGQPGMVVDGVRSGGPAETAGIRDGDRIIRIGHTEVNNIQDYMGALRTTKPGDEIAVILKREGNEIELRVKLAGR